MKSKSIFWADLAKDLESSNFERVFMDTQREMLNSLDDPGDDPWGGANLDSPQEAAITRISAEKLRPYMGMWVVIHEDEVIQSAQSIRELMKKLRGPEYSEKFRGSRSASLLWVPVDPSQDVPFET